LPAASVAIADVRSRGPYELNKEASLRKHAEAMTLHLFPEGHPQELVIAGGWFVAAWEAMHGGGPGPGHIVIRL